MRTVLVWDKLSTLGHTLITNEEIVEQLTNKGTIRCELVDCGKFRNGKPRKWCRIHQTHWGKKADLEKNNLTCSKSNTSLTYVINPFEVDVNNYPGGIAIWVALPSAINSTKLIDIVEPQLHVHARLERKGRKVIDKNFPALVINNVPITPTSALSYIKAITSNQKVDLLICPKCKHPHLDLGDFGSKPHRKHFCENCGVDSNWSKEPIISTPLFLLASQFNQQTGFIESNLTLDLREYKGCTWQIWSSTPAILWTSELPQISGIHVHIYQDNKLIIDETFGTVIDENGNELNREQLLNIMLNR